MNFEVGFGLTAFIAVLTCVAGWVTHIIVCISSASWLLLIAGAIMFPIGIVHGIGVWLGVW